MAKPRVAVLTELPTPYRAPLFKLIKDSAELEVDFYYLTQNQRDRFWKVPHDPRDTIVGAFQICFPGYHTIYLNMGMKNLLTRGYDAYVVGGYAQIAMLRVIAHCWRKKIPYVLMTESHLEKQRGRLKRAFKRVVLTPIYSSASAHLVMGEKARAYVRHYGARDEGIFLFPNTADPITFSLEVQASRPKRNERRKRLGIATDGLVFLFVGTLNHRKGVDLLMSAFEAMSQKTLKPMHLLWVGEGQAKPGLEENVKRKGLGSWVTFAGFIQPEALPGYYAMADVFVLPSREEPFGAVVLEAMAAGLPSIVSANVGAAGDYVVHEDTGLIVEAEDATALAAAMERLAGDEALRLSMGSRALGRTETWSHRKLRDQFIAAVDHALGRRS